MRLEVKKEGVLNLRAWNLGLINRLYFNGAGI
jgi:hypothetical protein